jgi:hypothetical protein
MNNAEKHNQLLEATLELGRNWGLAVAIAAAGATAFHTEVVRGPENWQQHIATFTFFGSVIWMTIAVLRFEQRVLPTQKTKCAKAFGFIIVIFFVSLGIAITWLVASFSDNNHIVKLCESVKTEPTSKIYQATECVRLRQSRAEYKARLEGD